MQIKSKYHILILCYAFPPYPGIGGRRWVKFAKYLSKEGYKISVISSVPPDDKISAWQNDIRLEQHIMLPLKYPSSLILFPNSLWGKIIYRIGLFKVKLFTKGNYYDRTIFWREQLIDAFRTITSKEKISHVIISGAPFSWFSYVKDMRMINSSIKYIADIRDPWTENESAYGYTSISAKRFTYEKEAELSMTRDFDTLITVNEHISSYLKNINPNKINSIYTLPNGYDEDELTVEVPDGLEVEKDKINLVFTGSFYPNALYLFDFFVDALKKFKNNTNYFPFRIHVYGINYNMVKSKVTSDLLPYFRFGFFDKIENVNALIHKANYALLFLTDDINNSLSTKFCEYIKLKKKVIVISKPGFTGNYVKENNIGFFWEKDTIHAGLEKIAGTVQPEFFPSSFDVEQFSIRKITHRLLEVLSN